MQGIDDAGDGMAEKLDRGRKGPGGDLKAKRPRTPQPSTTSQMAPNDRIETVETGAREKTPCFPWLGSGMRGFEKFRVPQWGMWNGAVGAGW